MSERSGEVRADWLALSAGVRTGLADWRRAHPTATFAEMEGEVETRLGALRARLLEDALGEHADHASRGEGSAPPPAPCPVCGGVLVGRGEHTRQVRIRGDQAVPVRRPYLTCADCQRGLFPPG